MPTYRTAGVWGPGKGSNLTPAEVDANFYELRTAIDDLIANPPTADSVVSVSQSGFDLTFHTTLGNALGPLTMPVVQFRWRGEWSPLTLYEAADTFIVTGTGLFTVMADHTSAATFDPDATGGSPAEALYNQLFGVGTNTTLDDLSDVSAGSPVAGQVLRYIGGSPDALWQPDTLVLDDLGDVSAAAPADGDVLTYQAGSPTGWIASAPAAVPSTLDSLTDVSVPSPADGDFLRYEAGSPAGWINEAGTAISSLPAATLPVNTASLIEISEASGSPVTYDSARLTIAELFTDLLLAGTTTLPETGQITSAGWLGLGGAPSAKLHMLGNFSAPAWTTSGILLRTSGTITDTSSSGTVANATLSNLGVNTVAAASAVTFTQLSTLRIGGPPAAGTNVTITRPAAVEFVSGRLVYGQSGVSSSNTFFTFYPQTAGQSIFHLWNSAGELNIGSGAFGSEAAKLTVFSAGDVRVGAGSALATNATAGFLLVPTSAGPPTGVPTNAGAGQIPHEWDSTNNVPYWYDSGWIGGITETAAGTITFGKTLGNGAAAASGTLTNAPAAGNPTKWIPIDDNGTTRHIPAW